MLNLAIAAIRGGSLQGKSLTTSVVRSTTITKNNIRFQPFTASGLASIAFFAISTMTMTTTSSTALATAETVVPARMRLTEMMKNSADWLSKSKLIPIDFAPNIGDTVVEETDGILLGPDAVSRNAGSEGSICFVVRRPGWVLCREHGQQLTELAAKEPKIVSNFGMFGVVKETGVDDEGLRAFQKNHFTYPLYRDENLDFYRAFGDGKITNHISLWTMINPYKIYKGMKKMQKRMESKNLEGNMIGEGLKTGGIIIFGKAGEPKYAYPEITGEPLETDDILIALKDVIAGGGESKDEL